MTQTLLPHRGGGARAVPLRRDRRGARAGGRWQNCGPRVLWYSGSQAIARGRYEPHASAVRCRELQRLSEPVGMHTSTHTPTEPREPNRARQEAIGVAARLICSIGRESLQACRWVRFCFKSDSNPRRRVSTAHCVNRIAPLRSRFGLKARANRTAPVRKRLASLHAEKAQRGAASRVSAVRAACDRPAHGAGGALARST